MSKNGKIIIIGGGASGLAAALAAAKECGGRCVTVLERLDRVGKKLLATGNGRCNLTNRNAAPEHYHSADTARLADILERTPPDAVWTFLGEWAFCVIPKADGRVYPYCYQASMVLDGTACGTGACRRGCGVQTARWREVEKGPAAVFRCVRGTAGLFGRACGFGCGRSGRAAVRHGWFRFCFGAMLGHSVAEPYPCLVPLRCAGFPVGLKGVRANCALSLYLDGRCAGTERGEVQFAEYGLSGIPAMQLSCLLGPGVKKAGTSVDFFPEMAFPVLRGMLEQRCASGMFASLETLLLGLVAKKLGHAILKSCGLQPLSRAPGSLSRREVNALAGALKNWRFAVEGTLPWTQAQVTGGGVPLAEVKTEGCASLRCPGLYLSGEVLDAAGDCGGFNLQWAWATGIAAGRAAARGL